MGLLREAFSKQIFAENTEQLLRDIIPCLLDHAQGGYGSY